MQSEQISVVLSYSILAREVPYQKFVSMVALRRVRATFCGSIDSIFARAVLYEGSFYGSTWRFFSLYYSYMVILLRTDKARTIQSFCIFLKPSTTMELSVDVANTVLLILSGAFFFK